jgi:hypothetical protein
MKSTAAYWALFGKEFPLYQTYFYKKGLRTTHGTTQAMRIHVVEVVLADIRMVFNLMCAAALA